MSAALALFWLTVFVLVLASFFVVPFALWCNFALARTAQLDARVDAAWLWALSVAVTLVAPLVLAAWKYGVDSRRISTAMLWLPLVWNLCGFLLAVQVMPGVLVSSLRAQGNIAGEKLGDSHRIARMLSAIGHSLADKIDPPGRGDPPPAEARPRPAAVGADAGTAVPFSVAGNAILVDVELEGPAGRLSLPYLFDTGASYTTVNSETAATLGLKIPEDAPKLQFNTASGPRESRMVYLPALRIGGVELRGLLVSVCDGCANDRSQGLLGLNVMREFRVEMDYHDGRMYLRPRPTDGRPNRAYDISSVVHIEVEGSPEIWLGRIRWVLLVTNKGTQPIENVVPKVLFSDGQVMRGAAIVRVEPGATGRSLVEGKADATDHQKIGFTLGLEEAYW